MTKTSMLKFLSVVFATLAIPSIALAGEWRASSTVTLPQGQQIEGNYYAVANQVLIEGDVDGDLMCAGQIVELKGNVNGDVLCAAQELIINGEVKGSVRALTANIAFGHRVKVGRNVTIAAANALFNPGMTVGMDVLAWAGNVDFYGTIGGSLRGMMSRVLLAGRVTEDVNLVLEDNYKHEVLQPVILSETAKIGGDLIYKSRFDAAFNSRDQVAGQVVKREIGGGEAMAWATYYKIWLFVKLLSFFGALIIAWCLIFACRRFVVRLADGMVAKPLASIGWGLVLMTAAPLLIFFLLMTVVGIPVAFIVGLAWLLIMLLAKPVAVIMVGMVLMGRYRVKATKTKKGFQDIDAPWLTVLIGATAVYALMAVPLLGMAFGLMMVAWVIGAAWFFCRDCGRKA